jgi:hypothetical protein
VEESDSPAADNTSAKAANRLYILDFARRYLPGIATAATGLISTLGGVAWLVTPSTELLMIGFLAWFGLLALCARRRIEEWCAYALMTTTVILAAAFVALSVGITASGDAPRWCMWLVIPFMLVQAVCVSRLGALLRRANALDHVPLVRAVARRTRSLLRRTRRRAVPALGISLIFALGSAVLAAGAIATGHAPAGPRDTSSETSVPAPTGAGNTKGKRPATSTGAGAGQTDPPLGTTDSSDPAIITADAYCHQRVARDLDEASKFKPKGLVQAVIFRSATWGGCPKTPPLEFSDFEVWSLTFESGSLGGYLIDGPACAPVVIAPYLRDQIGAEVEGGSVQCARPWTMASGSRYQFVELEDDHCDLFLQRVAGRDDYARLPGPVADIAFQLSRRDGGRPFLATAGGQAPTTSYYVAFDFPTHNLYAVDSIEIAFDRRRYSATATAPWNSGLILSGNSHGCPAVPKALLPVSR